MNESQPLPETVQIGTPPSDTILADLLCEWEDRRSKGETLTPEIVCREHPELIDRFRAMLTKVHAIDSIMDKTMPGIADAGIPAPLPQTPGYEVLSILGQGGMGVVYMARQVSVNRLVALKMIRSGNLSGPKEKARFQVEAEAIAALKHPNIVQLYEFGTYQSLPYFTLEFVEGGSLAARIKESGLPARDAAALVATLARAMAVAHASGIVHRDLKPENVLLSADGNPKITDFGLAKAFNREDSPSTSRPTATVPNATGFSDTPVEDSPNPGRWSDSEKLTRPGAIMGTPGYMSPEQARGEMIVGPAADIWALGAILYRLLTGQLPFPGATPVETIKLVINKEPIALRTIKPSLSRDLESICLKCLRKDPEHRYASAQAFADDLNRYLDGRPTIARPVGRIVRLRRWCWRNPVVAGLAVALVLAMAGGAAFGAWQVDNYLTEKSNSARRAEQLADEQSKLAAERGLKLEAETNAAAEERLKSQALKDKADIEAKAKESVERHGDDLEHRLYVNRVALATREWFANRPEETTRLLDLCIPSWLQRDRRNWEWHYVRRLTKAGRFELSGHVSFVPCVAWSADGQKLASGDSDGKVKLWLWLNEHFAFPMEMKGRHTGEVKSVAFRSDGRYLASSSVPGNVLFDNLGGPGEVKIWDLRNPNNPPFDLVQGGSAAVAWSPDGNLATDGKGSIALWDPVGGKRVKTLGEKVGAVRGLAFSPDGKRLAAVADGAELSFAGFVKVWEVESGKELLSYVAHSLWAYSLAWSHDGKRLVTGGGDNVATVWDADTGRKLQNLWGHTKSVHAVSFSPSPGSEKIATASVDGLIKLWGAESGQELATFRKSSTGPIWSLAFRPDGKRLATSGMDFSIEIWDAARPPDYHVQYGDIYFLAASPDGRSIAGGGQFAGAGATVWGLRTERTFDRISSKNRFTFTGHTGIHALAFSTDGRAASASATTDFAAPPKPARPLDIPRIGVIKVWNTTTGKEETTFQGHTEQIHALAFSPDGKLLASGTKDGLVKIWDIAARKELLTFNKHKGSVSSLAFRRDGLLASASNDVILWDPLTGKEHFTYRGHRSAVLSVAFSPDGNRIASAGAVGTAIDRTGQVKVWAVDGGTELLTLTGHAGQIRHVTFSPDGRRLATAGNDGTVKVWDTGSGLELITLSAADGNPLDFVVFTPDGLLIAGGPRNLSPGRFFVWDGRPKDAKPFESMLTDPALARADLDRCQGAWRMISVEDDGRKLTDKQLEGRSIFVEGDRLRFRSGDKVLSEYTLKIDPTWQPKEIDLTKGKDTSFGIYQLDGNELKLCLTQKTGAERPDAWNASAGTGRVLMVFKRVKP